MHIAGQTENFSSPPPFVPEEDILSPVGQPELSCNSDCLIPAIAEFPTIVEPVKHPVPATTNEASDVTVSPLDYRMLCGVENCVSKEISLIPEDNGLPPLLLARGEKGEGEFPLPK